jgi:hypothetical protein
MKPKVARTETFRRLPIGCDDVTVEGLGRGHEATHTPFAILQELAQVHQPCNRVGHHAGPLAGRLTSFVYGHIIMTLNAWRCSIAWRTPASPWS